MFAEKQCPKCFAYLDFDNACSLCGNDASNKRGRAYRRFQRQRIIRKRQNIIKYCWRYAESYGFLTAEGVFGHPWWHEIVGYSSYWDQSVYKKQPGRLAKHNLSCGCWMCKYEKHRGILKPKYRALAKAGVEDDCGI